jgi:uncharacterized membrane protein
MGPKTLSNQLINNNPPKVLSHNIEDCTYKWDHIEMNFYNNYFKIIFYNKHYNKPIHTTTKL